MFIITYITYVLMYVNISYDEANMFINYVIMYVVN